MKTAFACFCLTALASPQDFVREACERHAAFDLDGDGTLELERLTWLGATAPATPGRVALLLVEERLLAEDGDAHPLRSAFDRWTQDVAKEGLHGVFVSAQLQASTRHQDGRTLLAVRRFLRDLHGDTGRVHSVVLVGSFPEAMLYRTVNWRKRTPLTLQHAPRGSHAWKEPVDYLRTVPELVAHTCDLVLADLDGPWERLYTEPRERLTSLHAVFPGGVPAAGGIAADYEWGHVVAEDFFHVHDGRLETREVLDAEGNVRGLHVIPWDEHANAECTAEDRQHGNPIARPEIAVSRVNARGVALTARLDSKGSSTWVPDPALERRLLLEFFDRNHRYRTGELVPPSRPASLAHELGSGYRVLLQARPAWKDLDTDGYDVHGRPDILDAIAWLRRPALLRTVRAHSNPWISVFSKPNAAKVKAVFGEESSQAADQTVLPKALRQATRRGELDFEVLRTLWELGLTGSSASFYVHTGCEAISPPGSSNQPYAHEDYGQRNGAQSLLFFADGLALIGRAKVFYDEPAGFCPSLGEGKTFGEAWQHTFLLESNAATHGAVGGDIGRKRTYFWSLLGDATLKLP